MVDETNQLGDSVVPIYEFDFEDGTTRTTEAWAVDWPDANEALAAEGRADPECEVNRVGLTSG